MEIISYKPSKEGAFELARFDVRIDPGFSPILRRLRLIKSKRGTLYFSLPQYCVDDESNGEKKWVGYMEFDPEEKRKLEREILPLLEPYYKSGNIRPPTNDGCFPVDF